LYVDKETLKYPIKLRKWQKGDYFYPLGMTGRKKISKYFKDEKVSVLAKEVQWLLCSDGNIVWVVGKRADDRFKVTEKTRNILRIILNK
ncbi:MAG: tRNA lysidine(34) synthetase TilS, partial [Maribacter sp.]|nr:tRNA lysidine(34) synthetase TilS [Maribacter sp.]